MDLKMLEKLCNASGVSGQEKEVTRIVREYLEPLTDEILYDNIGSIVGIKKGKGSLKILLTGHVDEIGMIVSSIDDNGFVRVNECGFLFAHALSAQDVVLTTREGKKLYGVIGTHAKDPKFELGKDTIPVKDVVVDFGVANKEELLSLGVHIGDPIVMAPMFREMNNPNYMTAKSFDDRIGVGLFLEIAKKLKDEDLDATVYFAGTVQEEVGLRGAKTVAQMVQPDLALALDVYPCYDSANDKIGNFKLGKGIGLSWMDTSSLGHPGFVHALMDIADECGYPYQPVLIDRGGTDAGEMHKTGAGVPTVSICVPNRYVHTCRSIVHKADYQSGIDLISEFIKRADEKMFNKILDERR